MLQFFRWKSFFLLLGSKAKIITRFSFKRADLLQGVISYILRNFQGKSCSCMAIRIDEYQNVDSFACCVNVCRTPALIRLMSTHEAVKFIFSQYYLFMISCLHIFNVLQNNFANLSPCLPLASKHFLALNLAELKAKFKLDPVGKTLLYKYKLMILDQ